MKAEHNYDKAADITGLDKYDLFLIREGLMRVLEGIYENGYPPDGLHVTSRIMKLMRKTSLPGNHMLDPVFKENT